MVIGVGDGTKQIKVLLPHVYLTKPPLLLFRHCLPPVGALLLEIGEHDDLVGIIAFVLLTAGLQDGRSLSSVRTRPGILAIQIVYLNEEGVGGHDPLGSVVVQGRVS